MRPCLHHGVSVRRSESSELSARRIYAYLVASDSSIEAPLQPLKFFEGVCERGRDLDSSFAVQPLCLD
jgi:hypothetical protein